MQRRAVCALAAMLAAGTGYAAEVTVKNDSLTDFGTAVIVAGFVTGEKAASWLTSPCDGNLRAVQIFWRSFTGTTGEQIHDSIEIYRAGTFPTPGTLAETIGGPVLTDGVLNEWRYLDENNVIPLIVPVTQNETFVVAFTFDAEPPASGPSVVRDTDGIQPNRNAIYADIGPTFAWFNAQTLGVTGDWVIRAVIDCQEGPQEADVAVGIVATPKAYTAGQPFNYTIVVSNAGPLAAASTTVVDIFPTAFTGAAWTCTPSGGAACTANGSGHITQIVNLPAGSQVTYSVDGTIAPGTAGTISNSVSAVVGGSVTDPVPGNNTATIDTMPDTDLIFADGFEPD